MLAGSRRVAVVLTLALGSVVQAQSFEYAPGAAKYRVSQTTKAAQEAMGQKNEIEGKNDQVFSVTLTRSAKDTLTMNIALDSMNSSNSMGMPTNFERFVGMAVTAKISPSGAFYSSQPGNEKGGEEGEPLRFAMGNFLPKVHGALKKGSTWADTTTGTVNQGGMEVQRKTISTYTVEGDTTVAGQSTWKIVRKDSTSMSGSGNTANGPMTMEGTSNGNGSLFVTPRGEYLGGLGTEEATLRVVVAANGMEIGITQSATTKVERIR